MLTDGLKEPKEIKLPATLLQQETDMLQVMMERYKKLTRRERQIFDYIVLGKTTKEMAEIFELSAKTVENHRLNIMRKMRCKRTVNLVRWATKMDVI